MCYLKDFKLAEMKQGKSSKVVYLGRYYISDLYEHTRTCKLVDIVTGKSRIAHPMHLRPCIGPLVQNPIKFKDEYGKILNKNQNCREKIDPEAIPRSARIQNRL